MQAEYDNLQQATTQRDDEVKKQTDAIMAGLQKQLKEQYEAIAENDEKIKAREAAISLKEETIKLKDEQIATKDEEIQAN